MTLKIGNSIKELRSQRSITQDKLAEYLGVTAQAISRWENGAGYPDIELLPAIATFFGVSLDVLMGVDLSDAQQDRIIMRLAQLLKNGDSDTCISEGEEALLRFPSNHGFIVLTASAVIGKYSLDQPEDKDERNAAFAKWLPLLKRTTEDCTDYGITYTAKTLMIAILQAQNRDDEAAQIAATFPLITTSQEMQLSGCLHDNERIDFIKKRLPLIVTFFTTMLMRLDHPSKDDKRLRFTLSRRELERLISIWDIAYDSVHAPEKMLNMTYVLLLLEYAYACYTDNDDASAMKYLRLVSESAIDMNNSMEDIMDLRGNDALKAKLVSIPECRLSREEILEHNFSYMVYHGFLKGEMFSRISKEKEYTEICKKLLVNAK